MTDEYAKPVTVTNLRRCTLDAIREVAARYGALTDASVVRFALERFAMGDSLSDLSQQQPIAAVSAD